MNKANTTVAKVNDFVSCNCKNYVCTINIYMVKITSRCTANTAKGTRCKRETWLGTLCFQHNKKQNGLQVKKSNIRGARKGLFAAKPFKKNERVTNYTGKNLTKKQKDESTSAYIFQPNKKTFIDAANSNEDYGRFINDCTTSARRKGYCDGNNAVFKFNPRTKKVNVRATKNIEPNEEVYVSYGPSYWKDKKLPNGKRTQYYRDYRKKNMEKLKKYFEEYIKKNKTKIATYEKQYRENRKHDV